jgi:hypothetical protein
MVDRYKPTVTQVTAECYGAAHPDGEFVKFTDYDSLRATMLSIRDQRDQYSSELAAAERDAERYRWLRAEHDRVDPMGRCCWKVGNDRNGSEWCELVDGVDLDQMIDGAIDAHLAGAGLDPDEIVNAQHDETGRMWQGKRKDIPRRFFECAAPAGEKTPADQPTVSIDPCI